MALRSAWKKEFGFSSKGNGEPWEGLKEGSGVIYFMH